MGYMTTYMDLRELFSQVDDRLLKAAALEHPNNIDFAIDFIVTEVLPDAPSDNSDARAVGTRCFSTGDFTVPEVLQYAPPVNGDASGAGTGHFSSGDSENAGSQFRLEDDEDFPSLSRASMFHSVSIESVEQSPTNSRLISGADNGSGLQRFDTGVTKVVSIEDIKYPWEHDQHHMQTADSFSVVAALPLWVVDALESHVPFPEDRSTSNIENQYPLNNLDGSEDLAFDGNLLTTSSEEFLSANAISQTNQNFNVDLLEELINEAGKNKPILPKAVESLFHLMKEVDIHEKQAESAKEEAAVAGVNALHKVEELKKMLERAKEANDMQHAGEVYGEKSILATEACELQARLFHLSEERDKHLSMIEEMKKDLQARIAAADAVKAAAEQDKFNQEVAAAKVLAEQELIMEKVVAESKKLQQQAEENSKQLHEFLIDRGRIVDMLQGEFSLICEDVKLLKARLDKGLSASSSSFMFSKLGSNRGSTSSSLNLSTSQENRMSQGDEPLQCVAAEETVDLERASVEERKEVGERLAENVVDHAWAWYEHWELLKDDLDSYAELA